VVVLADSERLNAGVSATSWFATGHLLKEEPQLRVEQLDVFTTEDLGHKVATVSQHRCSDIQYLKMIQSLCAMKVFFLLRVTALILSVSILHAIINFAKSDAV
jgi:hypothetical protein